MYMCLVYRVFLFKWSCLRRIKNRRKQQALEVHVPLGGSEGMLPRIFFLNLGSLSGILIHSEGRVVTN